MRKYESLPFCCLRISRSLKPAMYQAELYSKSNSCAHTCLLKIFKKHGGLLRWNKGESILELGIGDGRNSIEILHPIFPNDIKEYVGTDRAPSMVDFAKKTIKFEKAQFAVLDVENQIPPKFENRFDHIFSLFVLHWVKNTKIAFKNIYDMLKSDGETFHVFCSESPIDRIFDAMSINPKWSRYENINYASPFYKDPNVIHIYKELFEGCGFIDCVVRYEENIYQFSDEKEFRGLMIAVNPTIAKIPVNLLDEYLEDYFNEFRKYPLVIFKQLSDGQEEISIIVKSIIMYGRKPRK